MLSKKATKIDKIFTVDLRLYTVSVKSMVKISSIFEAFLENLNLNKNIWGSTKFSLFNATNESILRFFCFGKNDHFEFPYNLKSNWRWFLSQIVVFETDFTNTLSLDLFIIGHILSRNGFGIYLLCICFGYNVFSFGKGGIFLFYHKFSACF